MWKKCSETYCSNMAIARGMCPLHYQQYRNSPAFKRLHRHKGEHEPEARRFVEWLAKANQPTIKREAADREVFDEMTTDSRETLIVRAVSRKDVVHGRLRVPRDPGL